MFSWPLRQQAQTRFGEIAYDVRGQGSPVVLVHGTPSRSEIWRRIAPVLSERRTVFAFDLLGFGESERHVEQDVSIRRHAEVLAELLGQWELAAPAVVAHDIGGAVVLRAHINGGVPMSRLALIDAVALRPWITPTTREMQRNLGRYEPLPNAKLAAEIESHLVGATHRPLDPETFDVLFGQWEGAEGQALYLRNVAQLDERDTADFEPHLSTMSTPTRLIWGEHDAWLDPSISTKLAELLPRADVVQIPDAGHFCMEDDPAAVAEALREFLNA
ncbi:MAG: alpha/beta hydrolase [Acidimicrobiia bacterium]|jgi:pimeloyl-ACP methyl ester carboxylesterase|nr:alpha/beta hydrolase [Acidimicrobiia bacterium]